MNSHMIYPAAPYDFEKMVGRLRNVDHPLFQIRGNRLVRTIGCGEGRHALVQISPEGDIENPQIRVDIFGTEKPEQEQFVIERVKHMMAADIDLLPFYEFAGKHLQLQPLITKFYGLRIMRESDPFECMVKTIIGQQLNLAFAAALTRRLIEFGGDVMEHEGKMFFAFPSPRRISEMTVEQLMTLQFSKRKAEYIIGLAEKTAAGEIDLSSFKDWSDDEIIRKLCSVRGIGRWTVECFLLFGMGRPDLLPAADIGLRNAVKKAWQLEYQPSEEEIRRLGADWSPWSSYITFYLWESLNEKA